MSELNLSNRTILVTGASRGIGLATCHRLLNSGANVIGVSRSRPEELSSEIIHIPLDLSEMPRLSKAIQQLAKKHEAIDGVILNAGIGRFGNLEEFSPTQVQGLVELNLLSPMMIAREFVPRLKRKGFGDLVFIGSESALQGGRKGAVYSATKFGLRGFAQSLRHECGVSGVRVGIVNPGMVDTGFFDQLQFRPGRADDQHLVAKDVAAAVTQMLSARKGTMVDEINLSPANHVIDFRRPD